MRLEISVSNHCISCQGALRIAELARAVPDLDVAVIDIDRATDAIPSKVVAVPTYLLDARVVSMGNPDRLAFVTFLERQREGAKP